MASPASIRELRYLASTTRSTAYVVADDGDWAAGTATKLRVTAYDASGLTVTTAPDPSVRQRVYDQNAPIVTLRKGEFSLSTFLPCSPAATTADAAATLLGHVMGGIASPTARTYEVSDASGASTTTKVYAVGIEAEVVGAAVLISGEVRSITAKGTNYVELNMALSGIPANATTIVISTTVYPDFDATQQYLDFLVIGHATNDQRQMLACQAKGVALQGAAPGELPQLAYSMIAADWQWVASGDLDQLEPATANSGARPPAGYGVGGLWLQDHGTTTRTVYKGADLAVPQLAPVIEVPQHGVLGGIDYVRVAPDGFKASLKLLHDEDMPGLQADLFAGTAKQLIMQWGNAATACAAVELPRCYVNSDPKASEIGGLSAVELEMIATSNSITTNDLTLAPIRVHCF